MPPKLKPPVVEEFDLPITSKLLNDGEEPAEENMAKVTIKQASEGENLLRMALWEKFEKKLDPETLTIAISQSVSPAVVKRKEVFLTLDSCNILKPDGELLFQMPMDEKDFNLAYGTLPPAIADEIHSKVLAVNIGWALQGE